MTKSDPGALILEVARYVQGVLDSAYAQPGVPVAESALDQVGLRDGLDIVADYVQHNEYGLALDHLMYMVNEPEILVPDWAAEKLRRVGILMKIADPTAKLRKTSP